MCEGGQRDPERHPKTVKKRHFLSCPVKNMVCPAPPETPKHPANDHKITVSHLVNFQAQSASNEDAETCAIEAISGRENSSPLYNRAQHKSKLKNFYKSFFFGKNLDFKWKGWEAHSVEVT